MALDRQQLFPHLRAARLAANWALGSAPISSLSKGCEFPGWTRRCVQCCMLLCDATCAHDRQPAFLWPGRLVTGLRGSVLGKEQGQEGVLDDLSDARSNTQHPGQPCRFWPVVCCGRWTSIAWTSGSIPMRLRPTAAGSQRKSSRHTQNTQPLLEKCGVVIGGAAAASRRGLGKKDVQLANDNPPSPGPRSAWHHPERARNPEVARGPRSHSGHHL